MMVTRSGGETDGAKGSECCMCGDYGLSDELFQCEVCSFRSQHRYCSNLYPKAESYRVCNWCLMTPTDRPATKSTQNSTSPASTSHGNGDREGEGTIRSTGKKSRADTPAGDQRPVVRVDGRDPNKQQRKMLSLPPSPLSQSATRKRIITRGALEERLRRTKSEDIITGSTNESGDNNHSQGIIRKQVFRNKVRRYKLLDEVSS